MKKAIMKKRAVLFKKKLVLHARRQSKGSLGGKGTMYMG